MNKRVIILLLVAVLVLVAAVVCTVRWQAWFGNPPEEPYDVPPVQDRVVLGYMPDGASDTRRISWRCSATLTSACVQYVRQGNVDTLQAPAVGAVVASRAGRQAWYQACLAPDLTAGSQYSYRLVNDTIHSPWYSFQVKPDTASLDFILFGDVQGEAGDASASLFTEVASRYPDMHFWAFVGDLAERPTDTYWQVVFDALGDIPKQMPILACPGNHEHLKGLSKKLDPRWPWMFGRIDTVGGVWHYPDHYSVDFPLLRFTLFDTDAPAMPWDYLSLHYRYRDYPFHGLGSTKPWALVMMHHPIYAGSIGRDNPLLRWSLKPVFERQRVDAVFTGHDHSYSRRTTRAGADKTVPIYLLANSSEKYYLSACDPLADKVASARRLYTHVHITDDTLSLRSYLADDHSLYDEVVCTRRSDGSVCVDDRGGNYPEYLDIPEWYQRESKKRQRNDFLKRREQRRSSIE